MQENSNEQPIRPGTNFILVSRTDGIRKLFQLQDELQQFLNDSVITESILEEHYSDVTSAILKLHNMSLVIGGEYPYERFLKEGLNEEEIIILIDEGFLEKHLTLLQDFWDEIEHYNYDYLKLIMEHRDKGGTCYELQRDRLQKISSFVNDNLINGHEKVLTLNIIVDMDKILMSLVNLESSIKELSGCIQKR